MTSEGDKTNKWGRRVGRFLVVVFIAVLFACGGIVLFGNRPINGVMVDQLEADLKKQLPYGSTWEKAEVWFASHDIQPGVMVDTNSGARGLCATVPNDTLLDSAEINIALYFDSDGRLAERSIRRSISSL